MFDIDTRIISQFKTQKYINHQLLMIAYVKTIDMYEFVFINLNCKIFYEIEKSFKCYDHSIYK